MSNKFRKNAPQGATPRPLRTIPAPIPDAPAARRFRQEGWLQQLVLQQRLATHEAWRRLRQAPLGALLTCSVLGIALALPVGLYALVDNARQLSKGWNSSVQISVFLRQNLPSAQIDQIAAHIRQRPEVHSAHSISSQQAWDEFRAASGLGAALDVVDENPLPAVLLVQPELRGSDSARLTQLLNALQAEPGVASAQLDTAWVQRLYALLDLAQQTIAWLSGLAALAVLLIVGNTIRLMSQSYHEQIEVYKLLGATNHYVRRPFIYVGAAYGLGGGLVAWVIVAVSFNGFSHGVSQVAALYGSQFLVASPGPWAILALLAGGLALGVGGSWLAVSRYLRVINPS
ncbi:MAG: permease-like cell division protein FtsX [Pseudomonadota bacterium]